jgi:hypothetical protein
VVDRTTSWTRVGECRYSATILILGTVEKSSYYAEANVHAVINCVRMQCAPEI